MGEAAVLPTGLLLSLIAVRVPLYMGWRAWEMVPKPGVAIADQQS
jgi:hypothetical protein